MDFISDTDNKSEVVYYKEICPKDEWILIDSKYAHGFYALENSIFEYICVGEYSEKNEKSYNISDLIKEKLNITNSLLSEKDKLGSRYGKALKLILNEKNNTI